LTREIRTDLRLTEPRFVPFRFAAWRWPPRFASEFCPFRCSSLTRPISARRRGFTSLGAVHRPTSEQHRRRPLPLYGPGNRPGRLESFGYAWFTSHSVVSTAWSREVIRNPRQMSANPKEEDMTKDDRISRFLALVLLPEAPPSPQLSLFEDPTPPPPAHPVAQP
jgi:hypothetical protein